MGLEKLPAKVGRIGRSKPQLQFQVNVSLKQTGTTPVSVVTDETAREQVMVRISGLVSLLSSASERAQEGECLRLGVHALNILSQKPESTSHLVFGYGGIVAAVSDVTLSNKTKMVLPKTKAEKTMWISWKCSQKRQILI